MSERDKRLISYLWNLDRKAFAHLRRSLRNNANAMFKAIPYVEPFVYQQRPWVRDMSYLTAGLFALLERPLEGADIPKRSIENLGKSIARLYLAKNKSPSIEHRFVQLLDADEEQLAKRLRQMMALLKSEAISIHWESLLADLCQWNQDKRYVQHRWARAFYLQADDDFKANKEKQDEFQEGQSSAKDAA